MASLPRWLACGPPPWGLDLGMELPPRVSGWRDSESIGNSALFSVLTHFRDRDSRDGLLHPSSSPVAFLHSSLRQTLVLFTQSPNKSILFLLHDLGQAFPIRGWVLPLSVRKRRWEKLECEGGGNSSRKSLLRRISAIFLLAILVN